jgi:hypothetical protein
MLSDIPGQGCVTHYRVLVKRTKTLSQPDLHLFNSYTGVDPIPHTLEETRSQILNTAAFLGDIFAMGLVPPMTIQSLISSLLTHLDSVLFCCALYLILIHAKPHIATPLNADFVITLRAIVVMHGNATFNEMVRRWMIVRTSSAQNSYFYLPDLIV